jgi:hypothetical protein
MELKIALNNNRFIGDIFYREDWVEVTYKMDMHLWECVSTKLEATIG